MHTHAERTSKMIKRVYKDIRSKEKKIHKQLLTTVTSQQDQEVHELLFLEKKNVFVQAKG